MGGVGKNEEKSGNLAKICTNFKELGRILESHEIFSLKIVALGGGNSWEGLAKMRKKVEIYQKYVRISNNWGRF